MKKAYSMLKFDLDLFKQGWRAIDSEGFEYDYVSICEKCSEYNRLLVLKIDSETVTARSIDGRFSPRDASMLDLAYVIDETEYPLFTRNSNGSAIVRWDSYDEGTVVHSEHDTILALGSKVSYPKHTSELWVDRWKHHLAFSLPKSYTAWSGGMCPVSATNKVDVILKSGTKLYNNVSHDLRWNYSGEPDDIVAYRLSEEEETFVLAFDKANVKHHHMSSPRVMLKSHWKEHCPHWTVIQEFKA